MKSEIFKLAKNLIKRLFPEAQDTQVQADVPNQEHQPEPEPEQHRSLGKKFELFMKRDRFAQASRRSQASVTTSTDFYSKLVEKEMQLYKISPNERPKYLELLFKALKTIKPTTAAPR